MKMRLMAAFTIATGIITIVLSGLAFMLAKETAQVDLQKAALSQFAYIAKEGESYFQSNSAQTADSLYPLTKLLEAGSSFKADYVVAVNGAGQFISSKNLQDPLQNVPASTRVSTEWKDIFKESNPVVTHLDGQKKYILTHHFDHFDWSIAAVY